MDSVVPSGKPLPRSVMLVPPDAARMRATACQSRRDVRQLDHAQAGSRDGKQALKMKYGLIKLRNIGERKAPIGIGGAGTCSPLPHHRTGESAYGGSAS